MILANEKTLKSINDLNGQPSFEVFKKWLRDSQVALNREMPVTKDEINVRWNQGELQVLNILLGTCDSARDELEIIHGTFAGRMENFT